MNQLDNQNIDMNHLELVNLEDIYSSNDDFDLKFTIEQTFDCFIMCKNKMSIVHQTFKCQFMYEFETVFFNLKDTFIITLNG